MIDVAKTFARGTPLYQINRFAQAHGYRLICKGRFKLYLVKAK